MLTTLLFGSLLSGAFLLAVRSAARSDQPLWTNGLTRLGVCALGLASLQSILTGAVLVDAPVWGAFYLFLAALAGDEARSEHATLGVVGIVASVLALAAVTAAPSGVGDALVQGSERDVITALIELQVVPASDALLTLLVVASVAATRRVPATRLIAPLIAVPVLGAMYADALRGMLIWANVALALGLLLLWGARASGSENADTTEAARPVAA